MFPLPDLVYLLHVLMPLIAYSIILLLRVDFGVQASPDARFLSLPILRFEECRGQF